MVSYKMHRHRPTLPATFLSSQVDLHTAVTACLWLQHDALWPALSAPFLSSLVDLHAAVTAYLWLQHDALWPALSAEEHLQLYGRLRGLKGM
jgi:hypothetical protein